MNTFARLVHGLRSGPPCPDTHTARIAACLQGCPWEDAAMAVHLLLGRELPAGRRLPLRKLRRAALHAARTPEWLFDLCRGTVGTVTETLARVLPVASPTAPPRRDLWRSLHADADVLRTSTETTEAEALAALWGPLEIEARVVWTQVMTGAFRSPVSGPTVAGAIARIAQSRAEAVTWLLDQAWSPTPGAWARLLRAAPDVDPGVLPRRFTACQAVDESTSTRTHPDEWWMEWMLGGTPAQIIRTRDAVQLWSATGELLTARHPDLVSQALSLPVGTVVEGHLMDDSGATPAQPRHRFVASDLLADPDPNVAAMTFEGRRQVLSRRVNALASGRDLLWPPSTSGDRGQAELFEVPALASPALVTVSDRFVAGAWDQVRHYHQQSRQHAARGLRLRRLTSCGAEDGWGEWQAPPMASRVVLLSVEMSPDSRELSPEGWVVGLRHGPKLVTVGRARLELPAGERLELEAWVRSNRAGRFGPVRAVRAEVVLGLEFDDVRRSSRHRAGLVFQGARVVRWVKNATPEEADDLAGFVATLQARSAHESG